MNVTVSPLGSRNGTDALFNGCFELMVFVNRKYRNRSFDPFIEVTVVPFGPTVATFHLSGSNQEVLIERLKLAATHQFPHGRN